MDAVWIDKTEVAARQIKVAVRLFFESADPVAIHTLIAPAHQVLVDMGDTKGVHGAIKSAKIMQGPNARDYLRRINFAFNFMKHADQDGDAKINIAPLSRFTSDFMLDSILLLQQVAGDIPLEAKVFWTWFVSTYPDEFQNGLPDSPIKQMQQKGIEKWSFKDICKLLEFADVVGDAILGTPQGSRETP